MIDELDKQLQLKAGGAHAHTAGKASFYLRAIEKKPNGKFSNCSYEDFLAAVRGAVYRDEWEPLSNLMGRWW